MTASRSERTTRTILFGGLGQMGAQLARHVASACATRSVRLLGYDLDPAKTDAAARAGGVTPVRDVGDVADVDVVCLSLPDSAAVREFLLADRFASAFRGGTVLDFSSIAPAVAQELHERLLPKGVVYRDAPVTGGVVGAEQGTLVTMIGGTEADLAAQAWIVKSFSSRIVYAGAPGRAALLKTISNMTGNVAAIASMEAIIMARRAGVPDDVLLDVLNNGPARSYFSAVRYPRYVRSGSFDSGMRIGLVNKDLDIAMQAAADLDVTLSLSALGRQLWADALAELGEQADTTRMIEHVARRTARTSWRELAESGPDSMRRAEEGEVGHGT